MPTSAIDSLIFRDIFGDPEVRAIWSDENRTQCYMDFEAALARAQASIGMIPKEAAAEITRVCKVENIDWAQLETGSYLVLVPGPSEGSTKDAIPNRLAHGEPADVLIMVGPSLDQLVKKGEALQGSEVELALSPIGMCVRAGAPVPDISTVDKFRQVLLNAKSIAYSDSSSGVYISATMFKKLGIQSQVQGKAHKIPATPVAEIDRGARQGGDRLPGGC
jgi:hypothetical protein